MDQSPTEPRPVGAVPPPAQGPSLAARERVLAAAEQGWSVRQIATLTGLSKSAVGRIVHAGRPALRKKERRELHPVEHRRKLAAERQKRKRQRDREAAAAERAANPKVPAPVKLPEYERGGPEPEPFRRSGTLALASEAEAEMGLRSGSPLTFVDGSDARIRGKRQREPRDNPNSGFAAFLDRQDFARAICKSNLERGLGGDGTALVIVLDPMRGTDEKRYTFRDTIDELRQAADNLDLPVEYIAGVFLDPDFARALRNGVHRDDLPPIPEPEPLPPYAGVDSSMRFRCATCERGFPGKMALDRHIEFEHAA